MTQENTERRLVKDSEVSRIPWREFIQSQFRKILGFLFLLSILAVIINLSLAINPDPSNINPDNIVTLNSNNHIFLMILSSFLFLAVFAVFTKVVLIDHREEFGIKDWRQPRVVGTFLLTTSFISLVYILLDISLINIYLMTLPTFVISNAQYFIAPLMTIIPDGVDRLAYSEIRGYLFVILLLFLFIFPLSMFLNILTRFGRRTIKERREKKSKLRMYKLLLWLVFTAIPAGLSFFVFNTIQSEIIAAVALFIFLAFAFSAGIIVLLIIFTILRFGAFVTYSNILLIFPFIFLFYLLPGGLWAAWDMIVILTTGDIVNTIYDSGIPASVGIDPTAQDMTKLSVGRYLEFYIQTVLLNLRPIAFVRIIQLDFIIVVGLSALVIGFAEGYSIFAIFRSIAKGVSIARTGRVATRSAPRIVVITSRLFYLGAWLSFFWDNLIVLSHSISITLNIDLPTVELPQILGFVIDFAFNLSNLSDYFLVLTVLAVPFYFILTSSFKFLSVSLVLEKVRDDKQYYYLLISSAYILIITNIFADIASLEDFAGAQKDYLPLAGAAAADILPFIAKIFEFLEAVGFYAGVIFIFIYQLKTRVIRSDEEDDTSEISFIETAEKPVNAPKLDVVVREEEAADTDENGDIQ